jgi:hypothetical protein
LSLAAIGGDDKASYLVATDNSHHSGLATLKKKVSNSCVFKNVMQWCILGLSYVAQIRDEHCLRTASSLLGQFVVFQVV